MCSSIMEEQLFRAINHYYSHLLLSIFYRNDCAIIFITITPQIILEAIKKNDKNFGFIQDDIRAIYDRILLSVIWPHAALAPI